MACLLGRRVCLGDRLGLIKFHGELPGKDGMWLGIEWDDASSGKHSGEYQKIMYFQCK